MGMSLFSPIELTKSTVKLNDGWKNGSICSIICRASSFNLLKILNSNPIFTSSVGAGINTVRILNSGIGYTSGPISLEFSGPTSGIGTFYYNETVTGQSSGVTAIVKDFESGVQVSTAGTTTVIGETKLRVSLNTGEFFKGETIVGSISTATYTIKTHDLDSHDQPSDSNEEIELEADSLLDFSESNPFGEY